jgi:predicted nucleic acid-binding protein
MHEAWAQVRDWLALPSTWCPGPTAEHASVLGGLIQGTGLGPKLVMDAHIAALAIEHGLTLCSADHDFGRFADLRWTNPLRA